MSFSLEGFPVPLSRLSPFVLAHLRLPFINLTPLTIPIYFPPGVHTQVTEHQAAWGEPGGWQVGLQEGKLWGGWAAIQADKVRTNSN